MSGFYERCMARASVILFGIAVVCVLVGFLLALLPFFEAAGEMASNLYAEPRGLSFTNLLNAIYLALSAAVWPFFGAAILWRIDRSRNQARPEAAE